MQLPISVTQSSQHRCIVLSFTSRERRVEAAARMVALLVYIARVQVRAAGRRFISRCILSQERRNGFAGHST